MFFIFTNTPTPLQGVYVFVLLGGGECGIWGYFSPKYLPKNRHTSWYPHRRIRCKIRTNAYRKSRHIRWEHTWCTKEHMMQEHRGRPKTIQWNQTTGLFEPLSQTTMYAWEWRQASQMRMTDVVKDDQWDVDFTHVRGFRAFPKTQIKGPVFSWKITSMGSDENHYLADPELTQRTAILLIEAKLIKRNNEPWTFDDLSSPPGEEAEAAEKEEHLTGLADTGTWTISSDDSPIST